MQGKSNKRKARTKAQQDWLEAVVSLGCAECGRPAQAHHMYGETAQVKIDLVSTNIGHWALNGLCDSHHKAIHKDPERRQKEKRHFAKLRKILPLHFGQDIYWAIMEYSR